MRVVIYVLTVSICGPLISASNAATVPITRQNLGNEQGAASITYARASNGVDPIVLDMGGPVDNATDGTASTDSTASAYSGTSYGHVSGYVTSFCDVPPLSTVYAGNIGADVSTPVVGFAASGWADIMVGCVGGSRATFDTAASGVLYGSMTTSVSDDLDFDIPAASFPFAEAEVGRSWIRTNEEGTYGYLESAVGFGTVVYEPELTTGGTYYFSQSVSSSFSAKVSSGILAGVVTFPPTVGAYPEYSAHAHFYVED